MNKEQRREGFYWVRYRAGNRAWTMVRKSHDDKYRSMKGDMLHGDLMAKLVLEWGPRALAPDESILTITAKACNLDELMSDEGCIAAVPGDMAR